jgi:hypothetical protein
MTWSEQLGVWGLLCLAPVTFQGQESKTSTRLSLDETLPAYEHHADSDAGQLRFIVAAAKIAVSVQKA